MITQGVVRPVTINEKCEWISPSRVVIKPNSTPENPQLRLVSDLRALNTAVRRKPHPFPDLQKVKASIPVNTKIMAKLDIKNGYHLLKLKENSQRFLNIASPIGILRYLRAPMGLRSSNDYFCAITQQIFSEAQGVSMIQAIDDFLICATDMADLERQLKIVVDVAKKYNVIFNRDKIEVGDSLIFVGMLVQCREGKPPLMAPDPKSVEALQAITLPQTKKELRQFLGLANVLSKYAPDHQRKTKDLYALLSSFTGPKCWTPQLVKVFQSVKSYLCNPKNSVHAFNPKLPIAIYTDASEIYGPGFGAIMYNESLKDPNILTPICMDSTFIPRSKAILHSTTLELAAMAWALQKFHHYTAGAPNIKIYSDSAAAVAILKKDISDITDPYHLKLVQIITRYSITPIHILRAKNMHADLLSKYPWLPSSQLPHSIVNALESNMAVCHINLINVNDNHQVSVNTDIRLDFIEQQQKEDPTYNQILGAVEEGKKLHQLAADHPIKTLKLDLPHLGTVKDRKILTYHGKIFIPDPAIPDVLLALHEGHAGFERSRLAAKQSVFWPSMNTDIMKKTSSCEACAKFSNIRSPANPTLDTFETSVAALKPMQHVQADLFEPKAGTIFLVIVDKASSFVFVEKIASKSCKNIIKGLESVFEHFGSPQIFGSDNMLGFAGKELAAFLAKRGIARNPGAPYFSNHQQYVEGAINIIKRLYQKALLNKTSFSRAVFLHNAFPAASGKYSPFQIMFSRPANISIALPSPDNIPSSAHQILQKQLLKDIRDQNLSRRLHPARNSLPIGTKVRVYDKISKTYPHEATIMEKLRNSSYLLEFHTRDRPVLARHRRHILIPDEDTVTTQNQPKENTHNTNN